MIRHVVMFELSKEAEGRSAIENAVIAKEKLLLLQQKMDVIKNMEIGINDTEADSTNFTFCLICDFDSLEDLNYYTTHPDHLEVGAFLRKVRLGRACVDYVF